MIATTTTTPPVSRPPRISLRLRLVALATTPVSWACYRPDRSVGGYHDPRGSGFVRLVRLATVDADGREHEARLSPAEARALGGRLIANADRIDAMNGLHGNGHV